MNEMEGPFVYTEIQVNNENPLIYTIQREEMI